MSQRTNRRIGSESAAGPGESPWYQTYKIPIAIIVFALVFKFIIASHWVLGYGQAASGMLIG